MPLEIKVTEQSTPDERRKAWADIQKLSPDMADAIKVVTAAFGKLSAIEVTEIVRGCS